uniref:Fibronectin type-III domain-containing protein n=1 Tax=Biomphalaria glabrata TaxID=6526 RepID=A0A2C9LF05_BIOGL
MTPLVKELILVNRLHVYLAHYFTLTSWQFPLSSSSLSTLGSIANCDNTTVTKEFAEGDAIQFCCTLAPAQCNRMTINDTLFVAPLDCSRNVPEHQDRMNTCSVKFNKPNATISDTGFYKCCNRMSPNVPALSVVKLYVVNQPKPPVIVDFICSDQMDIEVWLDTVELDETWTDSYNITILESRGNQTLCSITCTDAPEPRMRTCFCQGSGSALPSFRNVTVVVEVSRSFQRVQTETELNLAQHIRPSAVSALDILNTSQSELLLVIQHNYNTQRMFSWMTLADRPFHYEITLTSIVDLSQSVQIQVPCPETSPKETMVGVRVQNLSSFTSYNVTVSGVGGGGAGRSVSRVFRTDKSVPAHPPKDLLFSRVPTHNKNQSCVTIYWQPLPLSARGGNNVTYLISLMSRIKKDLEATYATFGPAFQSCEMTWDPLVLKVWSVNEMGRSKAFSEILIPHDKDSSKPQMLVEFDGSLVHIIIRLPEVPYIKSLAVYICDARADSTSDMCNGYPKHIVRYPVDPSNTTNRNIYLTLRLSKNDVVGSQTSNYVTEVQFYDMKNLTTKLTNPKTAVGNMTLTWQDSTQIMNTANMGEVTCEDIADGGNTTFELDREDPIVFLSLNENDTWTAMSPADSYYNSRYRGADLILKQFQKNNDQICLNISQQFHPKVAKSFFSSAFQVYSSLDESCSKDDRFVLQVENPRHSAATVELPPGLQYVCVVGLSRCKSYRSEPTLHKVTYGLEKETIKGAYVVIIVVSVLTTIVVVSILAWFILKCIKRRRKWSLYKETDQSSIELNETDSCQTDTSSHSRSIDSNDTNNASTADQRPVNDNLDIGETSDPGGHTSYVVMNHTSDHSSTSDSRKSLLPGPSRRRLKTSSNSDAQPDRANIEQIVLDQTFWDTIGADTMNTNNSSNNKEDPTTTSNNSTFDDQIRTNTMNFHSNSNYTADTTISSSIHKSNTTAISNTITTNYVDQCNNNPINNHYILDDSSSTSETELSKCSQNSTRTSASSTGSNGSHSSAERVSNCSDQVETCLNYYGQCTFHYDKENFT